MTRHDYTRALEALCRLGDSSTLPDAQRYRYEHTIRHALQSAPKIDFEGLKAEAIEHVRHWWGEEPTLAVTHAASIKEAIDYIAAKYPHLKKE